MYSILLSAGWPIWPLLALSIFGLAILMERTWYLRQARIAPQTDLEVAFGLAEGMASGKAAPAGLIQDLRQGSVIGTLRSASLEKSPLLGSPAFEEALVQMAWALLARPQELQAAGLALGARPIK